MTIERLASADEVVETAKSVVPPPSDPADLRIVAYQTHVSAPQIVAGTPHRQWMEETPNRFAYRCLPLVIGNQFGWDIINPTPFRARWLGGAPPTDVQVEYQKEAQCLASGHFGSAVLTFNTGYLFRTPPGIGLVVMGPPNSPKDGIYPLVGYVETDWNHASFTMNYLFTRPNHWVEFQAGESFCRIVPTSVDTAESLQAIQAPIDSAPILAKQYHDWSKNRDNFNRELGNPWSKQAQVGWQKEYFQGRQPDGKRTDGHRTQVKLDAFEGEANDTPRAMRARSSESSQKIGKRTGLNAQYFLWEDTTCFVTRQEKHGEVLVGIAETLRRHRPLGCEEDLFLNSFEYLSAADPDVVSDLLSEPRTYFWTRMAFLLIDIVLNKATQTPLAMNYCGALGSTDPAEALRQHLQAFRIFELSTALSSGADCRLDPPLEAALPLAIPLSDLCIKGNGKVNITGLVGGQLEFVIDDEDFSLAVAPRSLVGSPLRRAPALENAGWGIRIQPTAAGGLGLESAEASIQAGFDYQDQHAELIRQAMACLEQHASTCIEQLIGTVRIIGLKPVALGDYTNVSFSELPGAMFLSVAENPFVMADRIVHEFHHHRLFHIEDIHLLLAPDGPSESRFYSPWREDPRPLRGIFHGLYVYLAVGRFWIHVWRSGAGNEAEHRYATDQVRRIVLQTRLALRILSENAVFTPLGEGVFVQIQDDASALEKDVNAAGVPKEVDAYLVTDDGSFERQVGVADGKPLTVSQAVNEHHHRFVGRNGDT